MTSIVDAALAIVLAGQAVEAERVEVEEHRPVEGICDAMRAELAPKFRDIWDANNDREYLRMARRVGKTHYLVRRGAALTATGSRESMNPYILPTFKAARLVVWPLMKRIMKRHFPEAEINETMGTIRLPVGGTIVLGGCETMADVGRWYGMAFDVAVVDERGNFPDAVLVELDDEALEPSLMDYGGRSFGSGNPGRILRGRWYDQTRDGRSDPTPLYTGDARDNPFLRQDAADYFRSVQRRHGWTDQSPTFRRQYLGEWVEDAGALVFPVSATSNVIDALPTRTLSGGLLPASQWRYVIGVDVGVVDATAIAVVAAHALDNREFIVQTEKHTGWIVGQLADRLRAVRAKFPGAPIVLDTGGMGKLHAEELSRRFGIQVEAAEKREKESAIRLTRDLLIGGRILLLDGECNDALREEWSVLGWDDDRRLPDPDQADHASDATSYALRRLRHYTREAAAAEPELGTAEWEEKFRVEMRRKAIAQHQGGRRGVPWR